MGELKKLVLLGAGGMGREVATIVESINAAMPTYDLFGFVDDADIEPGTLIGDYPLLGKSEWLIEHANEVACTCTIGDAETKARLQTELMKQGVMFESLLAPDVVVPRSTTVGPGCVMYAGVGLSVDCKIGMGVLINANTTIGHDTTIGDFTSIMTGTGISGNCQIGSKVDIGGHAFLIPGRKVGDGARVAAGSIVFSHVKAGTTVLGNPARRMKFME